MFASMQRSLKIVICTMRCEHCKTASAVCLLLLLQTIPKQNESCQWISWVTELNQFFFAGVIFLFENCIQETSWQEDLYLLNHSFRQAESQADVLFWSFFVSLLFHISICLLMKHKRHDVSCETRNQFCGFLGYVSFGFSRTLLFIYLAVSVDMHLFLFIVLFLKATDGHRDWKTFSALLFST